MTLKQFSKRLEQLNKLGMKEINEEILREMTLRFLTKVIQLTPVANSKRVRRGLRNESGEYLRYVKGKNKGRIKTKRVVTHTGGTLRRGWIVKNEKQLKGNKAKPTDAEIRSFVKGLKFKKVGKIYKIKVVNPVHYAKYVNYGHRKRRGKGYYESTYGRKIARRKKAREEDFKSDDWVQGYHFLEAAERYINNPANYNRAFNALYEKKLKAWLGI